MTILTRWSAFIFCTALLALSAPAFSATQIGMVTGPKTGTYIAIGKDIAAVAKKSGIVIDVKESQGSIDNIKRMASDEKAQLGIVQSDVLGFLSRSKNRDSQRIAGKLRMVVPLYQEEVHLLARKDINSFSDLQGKRVVVGSEGSGSLLTSVNLFSMMNVTPSEMIKSAPPEGVLKVLKGDADAMIFVGGKPVKLFQNLEEISNIHEGANAGVMDGIHFVPLADPRMTQEYAPTEITSQDYSFVQGTVPTIAVTSVLMSFDFSGNSAYAKYQCHNLGLVANAIRDNIDWLRSHGHPKWNQVNLDADVAFWKHDECTRKAKAAVAAPRGGSALENDLLGIIKGDK